MTDPKRALRADWAGRRTELKARQPLAGHLLTAHMPALREPPEVVAGYWPMRSEIDPRPLMARFARAGWRLALPVTPPRGTEGGLVFRLWSEGSEMAAHAFGMREPHPSAEVVRPDVVLVPLLAFDPSGHRLGYGAGFYDGALARLRAEGPVRAIGLAFAGQETERLPSTAHDQRLDAVLTERGYRTI